MVQFGVASYPQAKAIPFSGSPTFVGQAPYVHGYTTPPQPQYVSPSALRVQPQQGGGGLGGLQAVSALGKAPSGFKTGITSFVDDFGYDVFGVGNKVYGPYTGAQPFTSGVSDGLGSQIANTFTPTNALGGFAGGLVADAFGLSNDNMLINAGASTVGAIAGQIAIPIPFVGSAVGSFIGSSIGGLFDGSDPNPWSTWNNYSPDNKSTYNPDGTLTTAGNLSHKHIGDSFGNAMKNSVTSINQRVHQLTGIDMSNVLNITGYEVNHGGVITLNSPFHDDGETYNPDNVFYFNPESKQEQEQALRNYTSRLITMYQPERSEDEVNQLVNAVFSSDVGATGGSGVASFMARPEIFLPQREEGDEESFSAFLTRYREEYNAKAVE